MELNLQNKKVLITGSSRGIGKAITKAFVGEGSIVGAHYNASKKDAEALITGKGIALQADFSNPGKSSGIIDEFIAFSGGLDVLILNAGIAINSNPAKPEKEWIEDWEKTMASNLTSCAALCRKAINYFIKQGGGIIVTISSRAAFRGDTPDYMAYAASKAGLVALTRSIARGYGKQGVVAFTVAPGFTRTEMAQVFIDKYGNDYATGDIALSELTEPKDIAPTVLFLASGLANHATGATIDINAGSYVH